MNWSQRMGLAIDYIEDNLDSAIGIDDVARVACCSKFHFHRMFLAAFNITCTEYIRRRRLSLAAVEILNSNKTITDIALMFGYESPNAFTRAFRQVHKINPGKVRSGSVTLSSYTRVFFPTQTKVGEKMEYKIVACPQFNVVGKSKRFDIENFIKEGPAFWKEYVGSQDYQNLIDLSNGRPGKTSGAPLLSVYIPDEGGCRDQFLDLLGVEVPGETDAGGYDIQSVPEANYAEFNCTYKTAVKTNRYIYGEWFPSTGYERDGNKPDVVAYFPVPFRPMGEMRVRWWIPIVRK